ncbi:MAG: threonine dehydratase [Opitutus sp.]|nr:threonine dehydratase [Opitutus sp.]
MNPLPSLAEIEAAAAIVHAAMLPTPQLSWPLLNARADCEVWVKHENHTPLGAFKIRGGLVFFDALRRAQPNLRGVIAATRGNHGQSVTFAARCHGLRVIIVVPHGNSLEKNASMRALGAELIEHGDDFQSALEYSRQLAAEQSLFAMPSMDAGLIPGVATYALEFFRHAPLLDVVYVAIGMGSGICGVMAARDALRLSTRVVGVVSDRAPMYALSFAARRAVTHPVTTELTDGLACRAPHEVALHHLLHGAERVVQVSDVEVGAAMRALFSDTHNVAEGAGAAGLAALLREREALKGKRAGIILSGANVDRDLFARVLAAA